MEKACETNRFKNKQDGKPDMVRAPHLPAYSLHSIYLTFAQHKQSQGKCADKIHACLLAITVCSSIWAAQYNTWLLIKLMPKGAVFSFLFFSQ